MNAMKGLSLAVMFAALTVVMAGTAFAQQPVIKVGISPTPGAFTVFDAKTGRATGATVEILEAVAKDAGLTIQYVSIAGSGSDALAAALAADKIDAIVYTFQITPARKAQYDFSNAVLSYGEALVIQKGDNREYKSADDLKGLSVGVIAGSNYVEIAKRVGANAVVDGQIADVDAGKIVAAIGSAPTYIYQVQNGGFQNVRVSSTYKSNDVLPAGFGVKKGNAALLDKINVGLAKMNADGRAKAILAKYGL